MSDGDGGPSSQNDWKLIARDGIPLYEASPGEFDRFVSLAVRRYGDTRKLREQEEQQMMERIERIRSRS